MAKLDLWKCDRCSLSKETSPELGIPIGWVAIKIDRHEAKPNAKVTHLCEACTAKFLTWLSDLKTYSASPTKA